MPVRGITTCCSPEMKSSNGPRFKNSNNTKFVTKLESCKSGNSYRERYYGSDWCEA